MPRKPKQTPEEAEEADAERAAGDELRPPGDPARTAGLPSEEYLREQLEQTHAEIELAVRCRSFTAISYLRRQASAYREELAEVLREKESRAAFDTLPLPELLGRLETIAADLPEAAFLALFAAYEQRHRVEIEVVPLDDEPAPEISPGRVQVA